MEADLYIFDLKQKRKIGCNHGGPDNVPLTYISLIQIEVTLNFTLTQKNQVWVSFTKLLPCYYTRVVSGLELAGYCN